MENFNFEEELKKLPHCPGCYIMHGSDDTILYVGKAVNLYNRVRSYFRESTKKTAKIQKMVSLISYFEYIITDSELEALVLENNLIKEHEPKYNTMLKDDKTYPYIRITMYEDFPRVMISRTIKRDRCRYFGPYTSALSVKETVDLINKLYGLRTCNKHIAEGGSKERPCLNYHMKQCGAPCSGNISKEEYGAKVKQALDFLNGNYVDVIKELEDKMKAAAEELRFEEAAGYRELIGHIKAVSQRQKITDTEGENKDYIALARNEKDVIVQVFFVREGRLIGREHFHMKQTADDTDREILSSFVRQYYAGTPFVPKEIYIQYEPEDMEMIEELLSLRAGFKVSFKVPKKGQKEKLLELARSNAELVLSQDTEKIKREEARTIGAVHQLEELLDIPSIVRMEAFDISNTSGFANVASMVVFENGKPRKSDYRKFKMKSVTGPDDYSCMREALTRRFTHTKRHEGEGNEEFDSFARFPDVIMMDGGKGQVNIALEVLKELGISIPVCGMVKDDNHRTRGLYYNNVEIPIDTHSEGFHLITRLQDEAHRFAIEYHRSLRNVAQVHSVLDEIPGIGEKRRRAIMKSFSGIEELKEASPERIAKVPEIPMNVAVQIYDFFHNKSE